MTYKTFSFNFEYCQEVKPLKKPLDDIFEKVIPKESEMSDIL